MSHRHTWPLWAGPLLGVLLMSAGGTTIVVVQAQSADVQPSGLELFTTMVPAYKSDRCLNCHGVVNPETGDQHPGGQVAGFKMGGDANQTGSYLCVSCHTENSSGPVAAHDETKQTDAEMMYEMGMGPQPAAGEPTTITTHVPARPAGGPWRLAPPAMSFVGKDALALCRETRILTGDGSADANVLLSHLTGDQRIEEAFEGHKGMDARSESYDPTAEPPPISQSDFEVAATQWVAQTGASCAGPGWHGSLVYEESHHASIGDQTSGAYSTTHTIEQTFSTRQVWQVMPKANPAEGLTADWSATISGSSAEKTVGRGNTSCPRQAQVPFTQISTTNTAISGDGRAMVDVQVMDIGNGLYVIQTLPSADVQQGQTVDTNHTEQSGGCGAVPSTDDTQTHPYPIVSGMVSAQAKVDDPNSPELVLKGAQSSTSPDGRETITMTWNLSNP